MKFTDKEISNFLSCYLGITDRDFSGETFGLAEFKFNSDEAINDQFISTAQNTLVGKKIVSIILEANFLEMILLDENGIFYKYNQNRTGCNLNRIIPSIADFQD